MSALSTASPLYKGKVTHRSWAQLPEELIRIIATYHIWDLSVSGYCPETWQARPFWQNMMVYTAVRNALEVDKFMSICPQWSAAMETHTFWQHAIALIDPHDSLGIHAYVRSNNSSAPPVRLSPYRHFRYILACSCLVCRINSPNTTLGLANAKRSIHTNYLGACGLCREHDRQKGAFCGLCLREAQPFDVEPITNSVLHSGCMENEDEEQWPGVEATCRCCRAEGLWRRVCHTNDREAVGGRKFRSDDWEARSSIDGFIDLAEGTISDVVSLAKERYWIRTHTKLSDMLSQALAANRFDGREERYMSGDDLEMDLSDAEDDDEEDVELAQLTEDSGVRDLALGDWARNRILDGFWISPADQWYGTINPGHPWDAKAVHPCPWTTVDEGLERSREADEVPELEEEHPRRATIREDIPPSYTMCENTYHAHQKQMRVLLLPAMRNIVRRLVIECGADSVDPAMRAARMTLEDVMAELRNEATWIDGVDWLERRRNVRREADRRARQGGSDDRASMTSSSSSKSSDESSTMTSPVLSTSTFQTTPSPPPLDDKKEDNAVQTQVPPLSRPVAIAVSPVLEQPRLIHPIPYVPVTTAHLPHFSAEAFKAASVWREACAPLYHCRCKICERAMIRANDSAAAAAVAAGLNNLSTPIQAQPPYPVVDNDRGPEKTERELMEIKLTAAPDADGDGEEEVEYVEYDDDEDDEDFDSEGGNDGSRSGSRSLSPPRLRRAVYTPPLTISPRKRSCDEIDDGRVLGDRDGDSEDDTPLRRSHAQLQPGTPPKRTRRESPPVVQGLVIDAQERMMHKRSSEELYDLDNQTDGALDGLRTKRVKVSEEAESPPTSLTAEDSEHSTPSEECEDTRKRPKVLER